MDLRFVVMSIFLVVCVFFILFIFIYLFKVALVDVGLCQWWLAGVVIDRKSVV